MRFDIIYADLPYRYNFPGTRAKAIKDYPTMSVEDICKIKLPIADDCILYLWAITQSLPDALKVMDAWGFKYKSSAVWDKGIAGTGYWFRGQHELLLVGTRGKVQPPEPDKRVSSVIREPRRRHSQKPDRVRDWISAWYPDKNKLEVFAREWTPLWPKPKGWYVWGNEVESDIDLGFSSPSGI